MNKRLIIILFAVWVAVSLIPIDMAGANYVYTFYGAYDELSGALSAVNVTAYFYSAASETFLVNGTQAKSWANKPQYFYYDLEPYAREFWVEDADNNTNLYIFGNVNLTSYAVTFNDLANRLETYEYVEMSKLINGTSRIIEKRKVDEQNKVLLTAVIYEKYTLEIGGYTFGDLAFSSTASISLDLKGLIFPDNISVGYRYVRCYAYRDMDAGTVTALYEDTLSNTTAITVSIYIQSNGTLAYTANAANSTWTLTWSAGDNETDYYLTMTATHSTFGTLTYNQILPRLWVNTNPFDLEILGGLNLPFDKQYLIPAFILLAVAGVFSALNTAIGLFATLAAAAIIAYMGWLPLSVNILVFAFALAIIFGIVTLRRRGYE